MEEQKNTVQVNVGELPVSNPDNVRSVYANNVGLTVTPWDLRLLFSEIVVNEQGKPSVQLRANVVLTPAHAKALSDALVRNVKEFEKLYGEITVPGAAQQK
jgi:hypothetical protein